MTGEEGEDKREHRQGCPTGRTSPKIHGREINAGVERIDADALNPVVGHQAVSEWFDHEHTKPEQKTAVDSPRSITGIHARFLASYQLQRRLARFHVAPFRETLLSGNAAATRDAKGMDPTPSCLVE